MAALEVMLHAECDANILKELDATAHQQEAEGVLQEYDAGQLGLVNSNGEECSSDYTLCVSQQAQPAESTPQRVQSRVQFFKRLLTALVLATSLSEHFEFVKEVRACSHGLQFGSVQLL